MLLSRVAESVYWSGRYLERAEATARMVKTHTELFVDLPKAAGLGWSPLLAITGTGEAFVAQRGEPTEEAVVRFLAADLDNAGSIRASVASAPGFDAAMYAALPSVSTFTANLANVRQARPQLATYPKISSVLGPMIVAVLLGKSQPKAALAQAAAQVNQILAGG